MYISRTDHSFHTYIVLSLRRVSAKPNPTLPYAIYILNTFTNDIKCTSVNEPNHKI